MSDKPPVPGTEVEVYLNTIQGELMNLIDQDKRADDEPNIHQVYYYINYTLEQLLNRKVWIDEDPQEIVRAIKQYPDAYKIIGKLTSKCYKNAGFIPRLRKETQDYCNLILDGTVLLVESYEKGEKKTRIEDTILSNIKSLEIRYIGKLKMDPLL